VQVAFGQEEVFAPDCETWTPPSPAEHEVDPPETTQVPTSAKPKVVVIVERVKLIPVASPPETVTSVGVVVEGSIVTVIEAD
jgi:hypothetical protein